MPAPLCSHEAAEPTKLFGDQQEDRDVVERQQDLFRAPVPHAVIERGEQERHEQRGAVDRRGRHRPKIMGVRREHHEQGQPRRGAVHRVSQWE